MTEEIKWEHGGKTDVIVAERLCPGGKEGRC